MEAIIIIFDCKIILDFILYFISWVQHSKGCLLERYLEGLFYLPTPALQVFCVESCRFSVYPYHWCWSSESSDFSPAHVQNYRFYPHLSMFIFFPPRCSAGLHGVSATTLVTRGASSFPIGAEISLFYNLVRLAKQGPQRGERRAKEVM